MYQKKRLKGKMNKKILFFVDTLRSGGMERRFVELLHYLKNKTGYEIQVIVLSDDIHYDYIYDLGIEVKILKRILLKKDPSIFFRFLKIVKKFKPDIIHTWSIMTTIYCIPSKIIFQLPLIASLISNAKKEFGRWSLKNLFFQICCYYSDIILANSYSGLIEYGLNELNGKVIYNGVRLERFHNNFNKTKILNEIGIKTSVVVIMVASFLKSKNYDLFLNVAKEFENINKDVAFVAVGDGEKFQSIKYRVQNENITNVHLLGKQQNIEELVAVSDIGVLFTYSEGISNSIIEYMALGKPVITTDSYGGSKEIIKNGKNGYIMDNNLDEIVKKLNELIENKALQDSLGEEGKQLIKTKFSLERMGREFLDIYKYGYKLKG